MTSLVNFTIVSGTVLILLTAAFVIVALLLALRNLRRGQGDRRGAMRIALFFFIVSFLTYVLRAHHPPAILDELAILIQIASFSTLLAVAVWLGYIAVEPLVRRRWPRTMISWSRLLEGRLRDPMVGRDLLIGLTVSLLAAFGRQLTVLAPGASLLPALSTLAELRNIIYFLGFMIYLGLLGGLAGVTILLALQVVTRNLRLTAFLYWIASTAILMGDATGPLWSRAAWAMIVSAAAIALFFRFGLLAFSIVAIPMAFMRAVPLTLDSNAWYFGRSTFALVLLGGIGLYGFIVSLGEKRILPDFAVED